MQNRLYSPCCLPAPGNILFGGGSIAGEVSVSRWEGLLLGLTPLYLGQKPEDGRNQTFSRQNETTPSKSGTQISHLQMFIQSLLYRTCYVEIKKNPKHLKAIFI